MRNEPERLHALDAVRAFALLLGIVLHGTMSFMPGFVAAGWPIADRSPSEFLQGTFFVIHVFRMTTFFVIAGFFAHLLFHRRGPAGFIKDRSRRVLVPLVVGWVVLAPLTGAILYWAATSSVRVPVVPPPPAATTLAFPLTHLWFLYVLALLYVTVLSVRHFVVRYLDRDVMRGHVDAAIAAIVRWPLAPLLLAIPVTVALYCYSAWVPFAGIPTPDMSLIPNVPAVAGYLVAFTFGWLLHRQTSLLAVFQRAWLGYFIVAIALTALAMTMLPATTFAAGGLEGAWRIGYAATYAVASWCWTFAIIGGAMRFLSANRPTVRYLADSSYWLYLLHLPLIFGLQQAISQWPLHWSIKFPLLIGIATVLLLASYHWLVRPTYIGEVLNGRRYPRAKAAPATAPVAIAANAAPATPSSALATLSGVHKRYGDTVALDGLDLEVGRGELLAVLGPNGAGKTTAIALLLGLQQPDRGGARLFGESPESLDARRRTGVMMQEVALAAELSVRELIDLTASYYPAPMTPEAAMEMTHTSALAQRPYGKLSGGQKRQVQFAMAICGRPQLLFLDEPTVGLDIKAREVMWSAIRELVRAGCSIVLTTHYLEEAEALADRVVVVAKGRAIASGSVNAMRALVSRRRIACVTGTSKAEIEAWPDVDSVVESEGRLHITATHAEAVVRRLLAADAGLSELEVRRAGLSEAFAELTQEAA